MPFSYGKRWWLRNASPSKWHCYDLFCGTTEDPIGIAGPLSKIFRRPLVVLADEIFSGSYRGDASDAGNGFVGGPCGGPIHHRQR